MVFPLSAVLIHLSLCVLQHFLHPPPTFSSQGYLGFPSLFTSLPLSVSPVFTPLLHLSLFHLYPLSALCAPASPALVLISLLPFFHPVCISAACVRVVSKPVQPSEIVCSPLVICNMVKLVLRDFISTAASTIIKLVVMSCLLVMKRIVIAER